MARKEVELTPDRSALHRFGFELRTWRKSRGLSQDRLGQTVHVSGDLIRLVETAHRRPSRDLAERCDSAMGTRGALVQLWEAVEQERRVTANPPADTDNSTVGMSVVPQRRSAAADRDMIDTQVVMLSLGGEPIAVGVDRRALVAGLAAAPAVALLGSVGPVSLEEGSFADIIDALTQLRPLLTVQDNILGPASVISTAVQQVSVLRRLSRTASGRSREAVMRLQAMYAELCGWLADDIGDRRVGQYWTDRALEWTHQADDETVVAYVLMRKAQRAADENDAAAAVSLARAALRRSKLPVRVKAASLQFQAQGYALDGNANAFQGAADDAVDLLAHAGSEPGDWALWCTPEYLRVHEGAGWMRLHRPDDAIGAFTSALGTWESRFVRDEGVYRGRLANAYATAGKPEEAVTEGRTAMVIARRTSSGRILTELRPLDAKLLRWNDLASVRTFRTDLRQLLTQSTPLNAIGPSEKDAE